MAHGIHSDLNTWSDFGQDLSQSGFDTWIIEPYGSPTTECSTCPVYTVANLSKNYWPALITGVQNYSGKNSLSYVGFDLGCSIALESLESYEQGKTNAGYVFNSQTGQYVLSNLSAKPINTFVGLGCISNISERQRWGSIGPLTSSVGLTPFFELFNASFNYLYPRYSNHPTGDEIRVGFTNYFITAADPLLGAQYNYPTSNSISKEVYNELYHWINESVIIGDNVNFTNALIIQSNMSSSSSNLLADFILELIGIQGGDTVSGGTDEILFPKDQKDLCQNIKTINTKYYVEFKNFPHFDSIYIDPTSHFDFGRGISNKFFVRNLVISYLANKTIATSKNYQILSTNQNCS